MRVGPVQNSVLVQPGEEQLTGNTVVVSHPGAREREAENPVKHDCVENQLRVLACCRVGLFCSEEGDSFAERREVTAQFL